MSVSTSITFRTEDANEKLFFHAVASDYEDTLIDVKLLPVWEKDFSEAISMDLVATGQVDQPNVLLFQAKIS